MERIENVLKQLDTWKEELATLKNKQKIIEAKNIFTKTFVAPLYEDLKQVEDKKAFGLKLNLLKKEVENIAEEYLENLAASANDDSDSMLPVENIELFNIANRHPLNLVIEEISRFFQKLNFSLINGNEVSHTIYNFDNLNITKDHVARDIHDTFFINEDYVLRTHCTSNTAQVLEDNADTDIRIFSYGNVFRKDDDDATHSHQFMQVDFVWLKKDFTLANLKWIVDSLIKYLFGNSLKTRYRLSYFPFTEPSFEVDVECWKCKNQGCHICKKSGWIEILGAGMLHQNVINHTKTKGITTGMAAGIGIERIAMLKYGINDIRTFYNNDFEFLSQFKKK